MTDKIQRLEIRLPKHVKNIIVEGAKIKGLSISAFVINASMDKAIEINKKFKREENDRQNNNNL